MPEPLIEPDIKVTPVTHTGVAELLLTITAPSTQNVSVCTLLESVREAVLAKGAKIVAQNVFENASAVPDTDAVLRDVFGEVTWPVTWLDHSRRDRPGQPGVQTYAVVGADVQPIEQYGRVVGSRFDDGFAQHCYLGDLRAENFTLPPAQQAQATFDLLENALDSIGMRFANVMRTWFYLDQILAWYGDFNQVRNQFFQERQVFDGVVPASTGIGSANRARAALIANVYAVQPHAKDLKLQAVPSPLQCPALQYGSSFSRAIEVATTAYRRLLISGTASIEPGGQSVRREDMPGQIALTMDVVAAILKSRDMTWQDTIRGIAYVKRAEQALDFSAYCAAHGLGQLPILVTEKDICRDELLFELELDAAQGRPK